MMATAFEWSDLRRWAGSAILVLGLHAAVAAALVTWRDPVVGSEVSDTVMVDLSPFAEPPSETVEDIPPGPKQEETEQPPPPPEEKVEKKVEEKVEVPPAPEPPVAALPPPEPDPQPEPPKPLEPPPVPPAPATTAPPRTQASSAEIKAWYGGIVKQLERNKSYPRAAELRGEKGVVQLAFSIDRQGHVVSSEILRSSGYPALDQETIATIRRAEPFPPPPPELDGAKFDFTLPVKFNIR
jgi:periplasmic protein TonB